LRSTAKQLAQEFGGVTADTRAPAHGLWRRRGAKLDRDDVVVYEVMVQRLDGGLWRSRPRQYEKEFVQDAIVIRALRAKRL
jgi:hypothetical protein